MEREGFTRKSFDEQADLYVINTCSVTENADKECRYLVRKIQRLAPASLVVVTGCYAQLKPAEIAEIPGVDLVLGASEKFNLPEHIKTLTKGDTAKICSCEIQDVHQFHSSYSFKDRTRSFLKVQDGCDYNCSFCTIPMARGASRSDTISNIVAQAKQLALDGVKEIVLTGVNLGDFGQQPTIPPDQKPIKGENFFQLIDALEKVEGIQRYRISSIEPNLLSDDIIAFVAANNKFMPHFHIPLQSGSNKVLSQMRRRYKRELFADRVQYIKKLMGHCAIGADVITGVPVETEMDFSESLDFIQSLELSYLHVFTYSERANTKAIEIKPVVPMHIRHQRNKILRNLSFVKMQKFTRGQQGFVRPVLFEAHHPSGMMEGYTDNYIKVTTPFRPEWVNQVVEWKL